MKKIFCVILFLCVCSVSCRVSTIKKFPTDMMDTLRKTIIQEPLQFLLLSRIKQELLVDKIVQRMVSQSNTVLPYRSLSYFSKS